MTKPPKLEARVKAATLKWWLGSDLPESGVVELNWPLEQAGNFGVPSGLARCTRLTFAPDRRRSGYWQRVA